MSTKIRAELSQKNKYWIDKHRYYELKHFCLQYPTWKKSYSSLNSLSKRPTDLTLFSKSNSHSDPVTKCAEARIFYFDRIEMVKQTAIATDATLSDYILKAVTEGYSYTYLKTMLHIPCCKDVYYDLYRRFFWLLNEVRL